MSDWNKWLSKKVVIETNSNYKYFGTVTEINDVGDGLIFIGIQRRDNGKFVMFSTKEILKIEELP